jgi:RimJ/RimL family protein N-acetyltransferase
MDDLPHNVALRNEFVLLRPWAVADAPWYVVSRDEDVFRWTTERRELTIRQTEEAIEQCNSGGHAICFAIADATTHALLGNIALAVDPSAAQGELHYWLARWGRGRGVATNAVIVLTAWAFKTLALEKIILKTMVGNDASRRVAERAGFQAAPGPPGDEEWVRFELLNPSIRHVEAETG